MWKDQTIDGFNLVDRPEDHPVINVSWYDVQEFCAWLSKKEGKIYRLPTDQEWSIAVGIGHEEKWEPNTTPYTVFQNKTALPWGTEWPPPAGSGNYSDESRHAKASDANSPYLKGYDDGFPTTAPVMSFKPSSLGLYDLSGNVWEWCEDWHSDTKRPRVVRGGSRSDSEHDKLLLSCRLPAGPGRRENHVGFRCVIEIDSLTAPAPKQ
jgi:formylglycine-generating enzyme required for sulfatase activity